jgi:hypothetical protein
MPAKSSSIRRARRDAYTAGRVLGGAEAVEDGHLIEWAVRQLLLVAGFRQLAKSRRRGRR